MDNTRLIFKVLSGEGSPVEEKQLTEWRSSSKENEREFESMKLLWEGSRSTQEYSKDDPFYDGLKKIKAKIRSKAKQQRKKYIISFLIATTFLLVSVQYLISVQRKPNQVNTLVFKNTALSDVVPMLEDRFHVKITVAPAVRNCRFTGGFIQDAPTEVIRQISESMDLTYVPINEESFRLEGIGCKE